MRAVIVLVIMSKVTAQTNTVLRSAWSNWVVGDLSCNATYPREVGWPALVDALMWVVFVSAVQCQDFRISSCHLWTSLQEPSYLLTSLLSMVPSSGIYAR